jgi:phosphate:Na+ symporter
VRDLNSIKKEIAEMSQVALRMLQTTYKAFMEHDVDLISEALEAENQLNDSEKDITAELIEIIRTSTKKSEKLESGAYTDVVADLELIGDYSKDILERIQIKIEEKLLFSDDAVKEYSELYRKTEDALKEVVEALVKGNPSLVQQVLKRQEHIDTLVDQYRQRHNQRLVEGVCSPIACNMFLNMLDFTAAIYYHTKKVAKSLLKVAK